MEETETFVPTSVARRLIARMRATHDRRRISIFSGPPGIGKTTAIDAFRALDPGCVVIVKVARRPAKEVAVLQHTLEAFRAISGDARRGVPSSIWELRSYLHKEISAWSGDEGVASPSVPKASRLTFVFDEAQNLGRAAIEVLRYWNDADRCYAPFPIGLIFVGNNEFALQADASGESTISAAVADRALHLQTLDYDDVTDEAPEFSTWIGAASGEAGRRKFYRWKKDLRAPLGTSRTKPHEGRQANEEHQAWARREAEAAAASSKLPIPISPRHFMHTGGATLEGFKQLGSVLARGFADAERVRRCAVVEDADGYLGQKATDPELLLKANKAERELVKEATAFFQNYFVIFGQEELVEGLVQVLEAELADLPEALQAVLKGLYDLIHSHGGVPMKAT